MNTLYIKNKLKFRLESDSELEVVKAVNTTKAIATGIDGLFVVIVKAVRPYCIGAITHLVNLLPSTSSLPSASRNQ